MTASDQSKAVVLLRQLVAAYETQLDLYRRWLDLAHKASSRVDDNELDEFLRVHGEKDAIARRLRTHDEQVRDIREQLRSELQLEQFTLGALEQAASRAAAGESFATVVTALRELLGRLSTAMRELEPVERETERRLRARLKSLRGELQDVHSTRRATRAYNHSDPDAREARFIDHKG